MSIRNAFNTKTSQFRRFDILQGSNCLWEIFEPKRFAHQTKIIMYLNSKKGSKQYAFQLKIIMFQTLTENCFQDNFNFGMLFYCRCFWLQVFVVLVPACTWHAWPTLISQMQRSRQPIHRNSKRTDFCAVHRIVLYIKSMSWRVQH